MSFKRKGPGPLASGAFGAVVGVAIVTGIIALLAIPASANPDGQPTVKSRVQSAYAAR